MTNTKRLEVGRESGSGVVPKRVSIWIRVSIED